MKRHLILWAAALAGAALMTAACSEVQETQHYSLFFDHIRDIAAQEGISLKEAATKVRELGYEGTDINVAISPEDLAILDELGFQYPCVICNIDFSDGEFPDKVQQALDFVSARHIDKLLLIPGFYDGEISEEQWAELEGRMQAFAVKMAEVGCSVLLEDFDNDRSPCSSIAELERIFAHVPELGHVFDSGNWLFSGENALVALDKFLPRVKHVHLKDRVAADDMSCPATGGGVIPMKEILSILQQNGYDGWYSVEFYGSKHMLEDARKSLEYLKAQKEPQEYTGYLFAHMTNSTYGRLYYSLSRDGKQWEAANNGEIVLEDYLGHPNISRGADRFYMMGVTTSGDLRQPVLWSSEDLVTWERKDLSRDLFDVSAYAYENESVYLGAPKIFYDEANSQYMVTWHAYDPTVGKGNPLWESMRTFCFLTKDWETFSTPQRLFDFEGSDATMATIDVIMNKEDGRYYALIKDERWPETASTGKTIRVASAESITGPYCNPGPSITNAWEEAPVALRKNDGTGWYLFTERYMEHSCRYCCREAVSFASGDWTQVEIASPEDGRHGCVIPVTEKEYQAIRAGFGN